MSPLRHTLLAPIAALAAMSFALPAFAQPQLAPVDVNARPPETIRLDVTGQDIAAVRPAVRAAAAMVCSNAVTNRDISFVDEAWCGEAAASHAMAQFATIVRHRTFAASTTIVLAAR
jgi:hypothetical protein